MYEAIEGKDELYKGNQKAPDRMIWVCGACGKTSYWHYGFDEAEKNCGPDYGWDASCMLNAVLCKKLKEDNDA